MSQSPREIAALNDILAAARDAQQFAVGIDLAAFLADRKTQFAVVRALEIVGEAAKRISQEVRDQYPAVPWRSMTGIRDRLVHDYEHVNVEVVWQTVTDDVPELIRLFESIVPPAP